jgi:hypothetical protein
MARTRGVRSPAARDYPGRMIPAAFAAPKVLRRLNIAAVGFALAASTAAVFGAMGHEFHGLITGVPTLVIGMLWAWVLRLPNTIGRSTIRWGWLASVPLAALNAGLAGGLLLASEGSGDTLPKFFGGMAFGATLGVFFWMPALLLTLAAFGLPIAWAQKLSKKGLAGEERGEWLIGVTCTLLALFAFLLSFGQAKAPEWVESSELANKKAALVAAGIVFMRIAAVLGALVGGASTGLAMWREAKRRAFVAEAQRGNVPGYRVDDTAEGKALVRVSSQGHGYRVADFTEEVVLLDEEGHATESRLAQRL